MMTGASQNQNVEIVRQKKHGIKTVISHDSLMLAHQEKTDRRKNGMMTKNLNGKSLARMTQRKRNIKIYEYTSPLSLGQSR